MLVLTICYIILIFGKYDLLDKGAKYIILILTISSIITLCLALQNVDFSTKTPTTYFSFTNKIDIIFLIGFIGWMPAPLDCAIWNSIWIVEKNSKHHADVSYKNL